MKVIQNKLTKSLTGRVMAFQGDPRTNRIRGKEKPAGPALLILGAAVVSLLHINLAHAEISKDGSAAFSINDETYLNLTLSSTNVALSLQPTAAGQFGKTSMTIDVDTNNTTGYNLTMTADTTSLSRSTAVNGINYSIPTLTDSYTCTDETNTACDAFPVGYWGYKLGTDNSTYLPMTTATRSIRLVKEYINSTDTTTLTFGTKLSNSVPTGIYQGVNLTFVAVTNYAPSITYMQEMDQTTADSLIEGFTYTLKDIRDNKNYKIAKLKDGSVWMVQNLAFTDTHLSPTTSNVDTDTDITWYNLVTEGSSTTGKCYGVGYPESQTSTEGDGYANACIYDTGNTIDGVFYNYAGASAMTRYGHDNTVAGGETEYSICPKRWRLPSVGDGDSIKAAYNLDVNSINAAYYPTLNGYYVNGVLNGAGNDNYWWLRNANYVINGRNAFRYYYFSQSDAGYYTMSATYQSRTYGLNIRCIFSGE